MQPGNLDRRSISLHRSKRLQHIRLRLALLRLRVLQIVIQPAKLFLPRETLGIPGGEQGQLATLLPGLQFSF